MQIFKIDVSTFRRFDVSTLRGECIGDIIKGTRDIEILKCVKKRIFFAEIFGAYSEKHYFCSVLLKWYTITEV